MSCICMYTPTADGGHARYSHELMTALAEEGRGAHRFELVTSEDLAAEYRSDQYAIHAMLPRIVPRQEYRTPVGWAVGRTLHYPRREWQFLKWLAGRPDVAVVHLQEWKPWLAGPMVRRIKALGKRVFYTVHNVVPHRYPPLVSKAMFDGWIRQGCQACDGLIVHTRQLKGELAAFLGRGHPPIHVAPHGVWAVAPSSIPGVAQRLSWKRLLFFGSIRRNKGVDLLLRAAEHLQGYRITIAGEPDDCEYFPTEVLPRVRALADKGLAVDLRTGFIPEAAVGPLFAEHSAVVLPYTQQFVAQSGVVFMAIAHGTPVVASEVGGLKDLFAEHALGTTFACATPEGLAAAVKRLFEEMRPAELEAQLRAARERYSWRSAARATLEAYGLRRSAADGIDERVGQAILA